MGVYGVVGVRQSDGMSAGSVHLVGVMGVCLWLGLVVCLACMLLPVAVTHFSSTASWLLLLVVTNGLVALSLVVPSLFWRYW